MTTVAFDGRFLVSDGRSIMGSMISGSKTKKIFLIENAVFEGVKQQLVYTGAGVFEKVLLVKKWLEEGNDMTGSLEDQILPAVAGDEFEGLFITQDGRIFTIESGLIPLELADGRLIAIGSGTTFAYTALLCGKTAVQAIEMACDLDMGTGGELRCFDTVHWKFIDLADYRKQYPTI